MIIHHHIMTKKGRVEFYLNPEYTYSTQQMWVYKINNKYDYWFFHRNYSVAEIATEIRKLVEN